MVPHLSSFECSVTETFILRFCVGGSITVQFPVTMIFFFISPLINQAVKFECQLVGLVATPLSTGDPRPISQAFGHCAQQLVGEGSLVLGQRWFGQQRLGGTLEVCCAMKLKMKGSQRCFFSFFQITFSMFLAENFDELDRFKSSNKPWAFNLKLSSEDSPLGQQGIWAHLWTLQHRQELPREIDSRLPCFFFYFPIA